MLSEVGGPEVGRLSDGQKECLRLVIAHKTSKEIARQLGISSHTVDQRLRYAIRTLGARTRMQAALRLYEAEGGHSYPYSLITEAEKRQPDLESQAHVPPAHTLMHQPVDLPTRLTADPQSKGQLVSGPDRVHRFSFSAVDFLERPNEEERTKRTSPRGRSVPVEKPQPVGEFRHSTLLQGYPLRWYQKLMLILIIAMMMIMSAGSLMVGVEALSEFLK